MYWIQLTCNGVQLQIDNEHLGCIRKGNVFIKPGNNYQLPEKCTVQQSVRQKLLTFIVCTLLSIMYLCPVYCYYLSFGLILYNLLMIYLFPCSKTIFHTHTVICPVLPVTKISAFPSGSVYSLTGTSSTAARYSTLGSKKMQGSLSWMQDNSRPFALIGPLGITICSHKNS